MRSLIKPSLCFVLAVLLPIEPNLFQHWIARVQAQEAAEQAKKELTAEDLKKMADEMEKAFKALEAAEKEISRDTFDPTAIVDKVGRDPVKLSEWVRDNTYWVPYQGCLRGHTGVLMDRLGSSLDRALLLAELLRVAGHKVRLAHASLTETQAKELLPKLRPVPKEPLPASPQTSKKDLDQLIEKYAKEYGLDAAEMRKNMDKASLQAAKLAEDVVQRVADQVPRIVKAIGKPAEKDVEALRAKEAADGLAALRDHWWVQRQDSNRWVDLDPLLPDSKISKALAKARETIAPNRDGKLILPSKYCHEVSIRIVIEQWKNERVSEKTVLSHTLCPSELLGQRIALNHYPMKWPKDLDLFKEKKPLENLKSTVLAQDEWLPILTVGNEQFIQSSVTDTGDTINNPLAPLLGGGAQKLGDNIGGILGSGKIGQTPGRKPSQDSHLTAEWIDYEIRSPGQRIQKLRRQIFDALGPAARTERRISAPGNNEPLRLDRGLALLNQTEILPLVCRLSPDYVVELATKNALANRDTLPAVLRHADKADFKTLSNQMGKLSPFSDQLYALAMARNALSRLRNNEIYQDSVGILSHHEYLRQDKNSDLLVCEAFDIVANDVAVQPKPGADEFLRRLEQGVLETNAEALLLAGCGKVENTAEIFAAADMPGTEWLIVKSTRDPAWVRADLPKDARVRMEQDLAAGYLVIVPAKPVPHQGRDHICWWRVDPITGQTLGIGEQGWGQTTTEKMLIVANVVGAIFLICVLKKYYTQTASPRQTLSGVDTLNCLCKGIAVGAATTFALQGWNKVAAAIVAGVFSGLCS